jgi:hypothetical protein
MKKYSYADWFKGGLILKYDYFVPKGKKPTLVGWEDFSDADILLIKAKQKEIFNERVANLLEKYKATFNKDLSSSHEPNEHIRMTISQIDDIFSGVLSPLESIPTEYWNVVFSYMELREIQEYYKSNIIRGAEVDYTFINSPSRDYQKQDENHQIVAHTLYLFRKWVKTLPSQQVEEDKEQESTEVSQTKEIILKELESIDKNKGWGYAFVNEKDLKVFVDLLTSYFEYKPFVLPQNIIILKKDCKTRFAKSLSPIHKELSNENKKLKSDIEFFKIIRVLNHFKEMSDKEIYQAITR